MIFRRKPTIDLDDLEWQIECWAWLLENLGGLTYLSQFETRIPSHKDFERSNLSGERHAAFVFEQVAGHMMVEADNFKLSMQQEDVKSVLAPLAVVEGVPTSPLGTYSVDNEQSHIVSYSPALLSDLEGLIATFAHEICHPILLSIPTPPPGGPEAEEFATDLAVAWFGFGIFGGNASFEFGQYIGAGSGTQGWATRRSGYLTQNEWGFALAVRAHLLNEDFTQFKKYCTPGLFLNFEKNFKFLSKNTVVLESLFQQK